MTKSKVDLFYLLILLFLLSSCSNNDRLMPPQAMVAGADFVGTETCSFCHEKMAMDYEYTVHGRRRVREREPEVLGCESSHGAGSLHVEAGGGDGVYIINPARDPATCFHCHLDVRVAFNLQYRHPIERNRLNCSNCHDAHGRDIFRPKGMPVGRQNDLCMECHREQTRPRVYAHEALWEGCTVCHRPHGSINDKLLVENDNNLCLKCHAQMATPGAIVIGVVPHTGFLAQGTCWSSGCHTAVHGSDINPSLRY